MDRLGFSDTPLRVYEGKTRVRLKRKALPGTRIEALRLRARATRRAATRSANAPWKRF